MGKRANHNNKAWKKIAKQLNDNGIRIQERNGKMVLLPPNPKDEQYIAHQGHKSDHPIRRWAKNLNPSVTIDVA